MSDISSCTECGESGTYINAQATGPVDLHYGRDGEPCEVEYEGLDFRHDEVIRCVGCDKIRRDLVLGTGNRINEKLRR